MADAVAMSLVGLAELQIRLAQLQPCEELVSSAMSCLKPSRFLDSAGAWSA
eukprot:CAMPEP_0197698302 /NCGR_PEP_ID=MMETSP1338-20131121/119148_1 /TAXON_ID=43686 ORGANISM="Pelagodinium beii, Strain RCC1491" /NCGR_SAMPLE_ID=MMETSP1338 /ASSEMBLY_ACC=CAM_ASM_000754 /LENGTH=50 /DNA_ID=CAMNT_0043281671 /DNA_START=30 /DNA_END=183 /DNA_ORIENTATION=-